MTYCEGIGLAIGDKIRVLRDSKQKFFAVGDLLTLSEDDGTQQPWFRNQHNRVICFGLTGGHTDGDKGEGIGWIRLDESGEVKLSGYPPICAPAHDPVNKPSHYMLFPEQGSETDPNGKNPHESGAKLDSGKVRPDLIISGMPRALLAVAEIGTFGAAKYTENGWMDVPDGIKRYTAAMDRHRLKESVEVLDPDSGLTHQAHLAWNALARLELMLREVEEQK